MSEVTEAPAAPESRKATEPQSTNGQVGIPPKLAVKIAKARKAVEPVAKNGSNRDQKYSYVRAEDVVREASKALAAADVIVCAPEVGTLDIRELNARSGSSGQYVTAEFIFRVIDGETGEGFATRRIGTATDYPGDKAIYKAETGAMKYFLAGLLQIPLGDGQDDPEATVHEGGGVASNDSRPASDKQKDFLRSLLKGSGLPKPAVAAITAFVGGKDAKKGPVSSAIEALKDGDPFAFARECGWDGTVDTAAPQSDIPADPTPAPAAATPASTEEPMRLPEAEGEALIQFCRDHGATKGEIAVILRSLGVNLPPQDELTDNAVTEAVKTLAVERLPRFKQMIVNGAESKKAAATADAEAEAPAEAPAAVTKAIKAITDNGYPNETNNLAWLLFDTPDLATLNDQQLTELVAYTARANKAGIQEPSVSTLIRKAREDGASCEERTAKFDSWITSRAENKAQADAANAAHEAAETPDTTDPGA